MESNMFQIPCQFEFDGKVMFGYWWSILGADTPDKENRTYSRALVSDVETGTMKVVSLSSMKIYRNLNEWRIGMDKEKEKKLKEFEKKLKDTISQEKQTP